jgi:hypothetical protein
MDFEQHVIESLKEIKAKQELTLIQTTKTNGRVSVLEEWRDKEEKVTEVLLADYNKAKGRDKILWAAACIGGTVIGFIIEHYISKT